MVAGCLSEEEIRGLKEMFKSMDTDNSGTITLEELKQGLSKQGTKLSEAEVKQLLEAVSISFCIQTKCAYSWPNRLTCAFELEIIGRCRRKWNDRL